MHDLLFAVKKFYKVVGGRPVEISEAEFHAKQPNSPKSFGLGDAVAALANPIAKAIDAVVGTKIVGCGGCAQRQAALNKMLPNLKNPLKPDGQ